MDISNGPGVRVSIFMQGCSFHCKNCFNKETWDFNYGEPFTEETEEEIMKELRRPQIAGLTLLGGEPFEQVNQKGLLPLVRKAKKEFPEKPLWCFTGYDFEKDILGRMITEWEETRELLSYIDILVDGLYDRNLPDTERDWVGSRNQRVVFLTDRYSKGVEVQKHERMVEFQITDSTISMNGWPF